MSQYGQETTLLMTSLSKNLQPQPNILFRWRQEDLLNRLRVWSALYPNWQGSYGDGKAPENYWFLADFQLQIYHTPALYVLKGLPIFHEWAVSCLTLPSLTHWAVSHGPIWLCAFGLAVVHSCTPLLQMIVILHFANLIGM